MSLTHAGEAEDSPGKRPPTTVSTVVGWGCLVLVVVPILFVLGSVLSLGVNTGGGFDKVVFAANGLKVTATSFGSERVLEGHFVHRWVADDKPSFAIYVEPTQHEGRAGTYRVFAKLKGADTSVKQHVCGGESNCAFEFDAGRLSDGVIVKIVRLDEPAPRSLTRLIRFRQCTRSCAGFSLAYWDAMMGI
jgi:hypothetical protein